VRKQEPSTTGVGVAARRANKETRAVGDGSTIDEIAIDASMHLATTLDEASRRAGTRAPPDEERRPLFVTG